jgi:hypothetical protein
MSLSDIVIASGATITPTGGTSLTLQSNGGDRSSHNLTLGGTGFLDSTQIDVSVKRPTRQLNMPNGYSMARSTTAFKFPLVLDNEAITTNTFRVESAMDIETTAALSLEYRKQLAQWILSSAADQLFSTNPSCG